MAPKALVIAARLVYRVAGGRNTHIVTFVPA